MRMLTKEFDMRELEGLRVLCIPSGIGEAQWLWSKMFNVPERFAVLGLDGAPRRLHQFMELHPQVEAFGYAGFEYTQIREFQKFHELNSWQALTSKFGLGQMAMIACNPHLEAGKPLAEWMPDLPTSYSYQITLQPKHWSEARNILANARHEDLLIGISCASYRGAAAWNTWGAEEWGEFLHLVQKAIPHAKFVLLGGSWDDLTSSVYDPSSRLRWLLDIRGIPPVGITSFGGACALLRQLHGYVGFSSGLGHVAAHLCDTPVAMLWPEHEQPLSRTWCDPAILADGRYVPLRWFSPQLVFDRLTDWFKLVQNRKLLCQSPSTPVQ